MQNLTIPYQGGMIPLVVHEIALPSHQVFDLIEYGFAPDWVRLLPVTKSNSATPRESQLWLRTRVCGTSAHPQLKKI